MLQSIPVLYGNIDLIVASVKLKHILSIHERSNNVNNPNKSHSITLNDVFIVRK